MTRVVGVVNVQNHEENVSQMRHGSRVGTVVQHVTKRDPYSTYKI